MSNAELYKPNELIGAIDQIEVSRTAKHLLNYLLQYAQLELNKALKNKEVHGNKFEVSVSQINGLAEFQKHDYERLKRTLITLMQPVILRDDPKRFKAIVPVCEIDVNVEEGLYVFSISDTVKELLQNNDYFTKLTLSEFNGLQSKHSIVLYEWLKRYETSPKIPQLTIEELRNITHTTNMRKYDNFTDIKLRILDVAVREINEKTPYTVSYETIKTKTKRRPKVTALQFKFAKKEKAIKATYYYPIAEVTARYAELADKYAATHRATREDFYRATYKVDYKCLLWFYENKHLPLRVLLDDIHTGRRQGRWKSQIEEYSVLVERLYPQRLQHLYGEDRLLMLDKQSCEGYLQQVLQMQAELDIAPVDINKWL